MARWYVTGFIAAFAVMMTYYRRGSPYRPGVDTPAELGFLVGSLLAPFLIGAAVAGLLGLFMAKSPGAFHRRLNWVALIALVLGTAGQLALKVG